MNTNTLVPSTGQPLHFHAPRNAAEPSVDARQRAWPVAAVQALLDLPFPELMHRAQTEHREHHDPTHMELATLLSIKTGGCPEDCGYCPQSVHHATGVSATKMMTPEDVREAVLGAKATGASRLCMGAAWRAPNDRDPLEFVRTVAVARITMPKAKVRLSAGRRQMGASTQALCFLAGANAIFYGDKLLVTGNADVQTDQSLLQRLGMHTTRAHA